MIWLLLKLLKSDMGFRCTSSPGFTKIVSGLMTLVRFIAFWSFIFDICPLLGKHFVYTYLIFIKHILLLFKSDQLAETKEVSKTVVDSMKSWIQFQTLFLWLFSIIVFTPLPFLLIYGCCAMRRKADLRQGWRERFDIAILKLMRVLQGSSRMMIVRLENHREMESENFPEDR